MWLSPSLGHLHGIPCSKINSPVTTSNGFSATLSFQARRKSCNISRHPVQHCTAVDSQRETAATASGLEDGNEGRAQAKSSVGTAILEQPVLPARLNNAALIRRLTSCEAANEALNLFLQEAESDTSTSTSASGFTEEECRSLIGAAMERGNVALALSIYEAMCRARPGTGRGSSTAEGLGAVSWPHASLDTVSAVVRGLARALRLKDAFGAIEDVRRRGVPLGDEVPFGHVVNSPMAPGTPLTVVQPHEGCKVVACASTRYEYEVFTGDVVSVESEALVSQQSLLLAAARAANIWRKPPLAAVHQMVLRAPDGRARSLRFGTATADVPAQVGERVSVVCSPDPAAASSGGQQQQRAGLLGSAPPFTKPGQPLTMTNHALGRETPLQPPPSSAAGIPGWLLPAAVILSASDAASGLIDPALPLLIAGGVATVATTGVLGTTVLLPRLKQLPERLLQLETVRQKLLAQHNAIVVRMDALVAEASDDVRVLARLWQLQNKMQSVGTAGSYGARIERVATAVEGLEGRLHKKLELLDGYARVANMIEIEVEIDTEVPAAEVQGIEEQLQRLEEVAEMQADWRLQAEAQDEVERLLRST
ncbi:hypothetical protein COCOBI_06-0220 [Coccomyxa sp. Obi]|nr:hypothetical protein COCOBI_06-0220 [Coccomyxa sp. Obi]